MCAPVSIGATTENPSLEPNNARLSRARVLCAEGV
jgi:replication-associated recombination protein RarA